MSIDSHARGGVIFMCPYTLLLDVVCIKDGAHAVDRCTDKIISKMFVVLVTFAVQLGVGCGQSSGTACPTLK